MKKICISLIILLLILSTQAFAVEDWNKENKKREEAYQKALSEILEPYKDENIPDDERIIDYRYLGFGLSEHEDEKSLKVHIGFAVTPYLSENTKWGDSDNLCFAEFSKVDEEYNLEWVSLIPKNYDKFLEKFEEYQKNRNENETVEVQVVSADKTEELKANQIEKMSNIIFVSSSIIFTILVIGIVVNIIRNKKH